MVLWGPMLLPSCSSPIPWGLISVNHTHPVKGEREREHREGTLASLESWSSRDVQPRLSYPIGEN